MDWSRLAEARIQEWLRTPVEELFTLLDATGRSVIAPMMAERVLAIRREAAGDPG